MDPLTLKKRGSLQRTTRQAVRKDRTFSVPCFLDIPSRSGAAIGAHSGERNSIVIYGQKKDGRRSIRAGTLESLVELLAEDELADPDYVETFIATHNYFIDSQSFMSRLMARFYDGDDARVIEVFEKWINCYGSEDFSEENQLLFNMFLGDLDSKGLQPITTKLRQMIREQQIIADKRKKQEEEDAAREAVEQANRNSDSPTVILYQISGLHPKMFAPAQIAFHLTQIEFHMFSEIPQREYLHNAWSKKGGEAKKLGKLIERFNAVSFWAVTSILTHGHSTKKRSPMLGLFIAVADSCLKLQNYQSAMQIFSALNMSPVQRLKDEWKALPKRSQQMYAELQVFFASENNFRNYRNSIRTVAAPAIPLLSMILSDLTMIEENDNNIDIKDSPGVTIEAGAASSTEEKLIHFEKMTMIYETLSVLKRCFEVSYSEAMIESIAAGEGTKGEGSIEELQWMLKVLPRLPEKELYEFKGDSKKKVKELKKAYKTVAKERKKA